jgi:hypothetical protein
MVAILVCRHGSNLVPADPMAAEDIERLSPSKALMVEVKQPRSLPQHRLLFALLRKVTDNMDGVTENALLSWLKVKLGYIEHMPLGFGRSYAAPASISFAAMSQPDFREFFDRAVDLICAEVIPGLDKPALLREVNKMLSVGKEGGPAQEAPPAAA